MRRPGTGEPMRTSRSSLFGVVIVALVLSLMTTAVSARDDEPSSEPPAE